MKYLVLDEPIDVETLLLCCTNCRIFACISNVLPDPAGPSMIAHTALSLMTFCSMVR